MTTRLFPVEFLCLALASWPASLPQATVHLWPNWHHADSGILAFEAGSLPGGKIGHLYEAHIRNFVGYGIRGVLWDQGESGTASLPMW